MNRFPRRHPIRRGIARLLVIIALSGVPALPAGAAEVVFPVASKLGLAPPSGFTTSSAFMGFEDRQNSAFIRLIALPRQAFGEIDKTLNNETLTQQGMTVEKREPQSLHGGNAVLVIARQNTRQGRIRKWLLIAQFKEMTGMVSFEVPVTTPAPYTDASIRAALMSLTARSEVPEREQLAVVPFKVDDTAGMRLVRVLPGVAAQFTEGPKDTFDATDQPHLIIYAAAGSPAAADRDRFARDALRDLPRFKDVRITSAESMRIGGQPGYEVRAAGKDEQGVEIDIIQWLRFGTGAYLRILGFAPKDKWPEMFPRFRQVRDGLEPR